MKFFFCLITCISIAHTVSSQSSSKPDNQLKNLVEEYDNLFVYTKSVVENLAYPVAENNRLLDKIVYDPNIGVSNTVSRTTNITGADSSLDFGIKWVSDATYNFAPGIGENEDVFFRSRLSTGVDLVILGEGSMQRKKEARRIFSQQLLKDSVQFKLDNNSFELHKKQLFVSYIFDLHRLDILKSYQQLLQMQSAYQDQMYKAGLNTEAVKINSYNKAQAVKDKVSVYQSYLLESVPENLVREYWGIPYAHAALPNLSTISLDKLLKEEEVLVQMQKELLGSRYKPSEKPSLRAKFRYNYYDNAEQIGRSFASVGASLSVPIRFGKENQAVAYQMATYDNNLYYEKLKLKEKLSAQHKSFYLLKNKLSQLQNDVTYIDALLKNEKAVHKQHHKNFSPAKYIEYAEMLIQKKIDVLDVKEQLSEAYLTFLTLSGSQDDFAVGQYQYAGTRYSVGTTYMGKSVFETIDNDSLINSLKQLGINTLLLSPGSNMAKINDFLSRITDQNIHVVRLLGENSYAKDVNGIHNLLLKLKSFKQFGYSGIHLNIEPHTFEDYKSNTNWYAQRMDSIYDTANQWSKQHKVSLSVSIPMHLPIQNAAFLAENNITAYIMAYDNPDQQMLLQRTQPLRSALQNNFVWVLRASDFATRDELSHAVEYLYANGVERVALYDFSTVTKMFYED